ncbi:enoyl-CoA hydratase/isomerase family protein [Calidifontibacter sp. DB0510]|uniref:3-hydroxyisobutyryl-CoA hydrolase n=1 Tax=Metallococcus carri TaxID=1656884 RepID=A0A967B2Q3_9MICO|nr:3-hydroxyisobutyryl-CoA hydrolase [Metallococcus carri]NHN57218.1 enoyl-CoA hydratase/isomerase family protein [Metallococcus carri]NOP37979.1 enoyl-CoA hydratase/isomerase family protein [Calidifontibacter sp. DB2511S]
MNADSEVLFSTDGALGRIVLNRPKAINSLSLAMVREIDRQLIEWADDDRVQIVSVEGAGERGLCAGGDVVAVRQEILDGGDGQDFFRDEYAMNARMAHYPKPIVAFQDGIVLGGGVGVSAHCRVRLVTDRSKLGMPETIIGFFADVGAMHLLTRAPGETGTHLALTGSTIDAADAVYAGLSDGVATSSWEDLLAGMAAGELPAYGAPDGPGSLEAQRDWIDECYAGDDPVAILDRLRNHSAEAARSAAALIEQRSPLSVATSLAALRRAAGKTIDEVLAQDVVLARNLSHQRDFAEGVRAQIVDKDRSPKWSHPSVADVSPGEVSAMFQP